MARSAPTAAGVQTEITLESLAEERTLKDKTLSLQPPEDQTFLLDVDFLKCRKALKHTMSVITSQEQEVKKKVSAKEKRRVAKTGQKRKREEEVELVNKVANLELVVVQQG